VSNRQRNLFVLLLVAGLLIASAVAIATKPTKLGLDLQGGVELVYQVKARAGQPPPSADTIARTIEVMRERVDQIGVAEPEIQQAGGNQINVALPDVSNLQQAIKQVGTVAQLAFYDWEPNVIGPDGRPDPENPAVTGGQNAGNASAGLTLYDALLRAEKRPAKIEENNSRDGNLYYAVDRKLKKVYGLGEESRADALAKVPAPIRRAAQAAGKPAADIIVVKPDTVLLRAQKPTKGPKPDRWFVLKDDVALAGKEIKNPEQNFDQGTGGTGEPIVTFSFTDKGRKTWEAVTKRIAQRGQASVGILSSGDQTLQHFAIALDNELVSSPTIDYRKYPEGLDGRGGSQIQGTFTIGSAQELANILKTGALPVRLELISSSQVSATLGRQALNQGLAAGVAGFLIVALFLLVFYRVLGVIAVVALAVYGVYFYALIKAIPVVLTLPGIAGLILTLGVAADANIVIFERVKEEIRGGRSIASGIATGYKKGLSAIIDANVVTIMVAFILFVLATAGVKGFALTLGLGVIVSLFTAVLATQAILGAMGKSRFISKPSALGAEKPKGTRFRLDYMGKSKWFFSASGMILLVCALALGSKGINFGIDFESGTRVSVELKQNVNEDDVRGVLSGQGLADAKIQKITGVKNAKGASAFQISTDNLKPAQVTNVTSALAKKFGSADTPNSTSIGPTFGQTVANSAIIAIIASLLVISAYIALRFEPKYAVPVLIAVMHDILITAGVYALVGQEVTTATVAALLTILGFSLYDTIIVFDRIRENVPRMPRAAFSQIVNRSMSEVIVRSLATSFCSGLPVLALLLFGGETLQAFAFALLVGTISGTYSSVFIAGPVLTLWKEREPVYRRRHARIAAENGGVVPAYATGSANEQVDPDAKRKLRRGRRLTAPEDPDGSVSREEFEELVRDLHVDPVPQRTAVTTKPKPKPKPKPVKPAPVPRDESADALPEDVVMPPVRDEPAAPKRSKSAAAKRRSKHGRPR
jgi:SecD/SecF fusion protein